MNDIAAQQTTPAQTAAADAARLSSTLELNYLIELHRELGRHIKRRQKSETKHTAAERARAVAECERIAQRYGMTAAELMRTRRPYRKNSQPQKENEA